MGEVIGILGAGQDPDVVLKEAIGEFESVIIMGYDKEGGMDIRATLNLEARDVLWLIESLKAGLLEGMFEYEPD